MYIEENISSENNNINNTTTDMTMCEYNTNTNNDNNDNNKKNQWTKITWKGDGPVDRHGHTISPYKNNLYLFGGTPDGSSGLNDVVVYDMEKNIWSFPRVAGSAPSGRYRHSAVVIGSQMYIFGGYRSKCLGDLHVLDLGTYIHLTPTILAQHTYY